MKKLYRSDKNAIVAGVIGGLGEYLETDPVFLRVIFIFILVFTGFLPSIIAYFLAALVIPRRRGGGAIVESTIHLGGESHDL